MDVMKKLTLVACLFTFSIVLVYHDNSLEQPRIFSVAVSTQKTARKETPPWPEGCNTTKFAEATDLSLDKPVIPRELLSHCHRVLYNRIPKCASRTFRDAFNILAPMKNLTPIYLESSWDFIGEARRKQYIPNMLNSGSRFILTSHFYFDDFSDIYGDTVTFINILREPADWFVSLHNWMIYGDRETPHNNTDKPQLEECVRSEKCMNSELATFSPIHFLCGNSTECKFRYNEGLKRAIHNLQHRYLVVGLYEDIPAYVEALEFLMPHAFSNLTQVFSKIDDIGKSKSKTKKKTELDLQSTKLLRSHLWAEYMLYEAAKKQFYSLIGAIRTLKRENGGA